MRLIDADELIYESIDSSDTARNEYYYGTGIVAIRKEDIDDAPTIEPPTTTWIGSYSPYTCKCCGFHVDSRTKYCPECGREAVQNVDESDRGKSE